MKEKKLFFEIFGFFIEIFSIFVFASLISYQKSNICGVFGNYIGTFLISYLGVFSYLIPIFFLWLGYCFIWRREKLRLPSKFFPALLFLFSIFISAPSIFPSKNVFGDVGICGKVGVSFNSVFVHYLGDFGLYLFSFLLLILTVLLLKLDFKIPFSIESLRGRVSKKSVQKDDKNLNKKTNSRGAKEDFDKRKSFDNPVVVRDFEPIIREDFLEKREGPKLLEYKRIDSYTPPSIELLDLPIKGDLEIDRNHILDRSKIIVKKLNDFGIEGKVVEVIPGPVVTMYEFEPAPGIKITKVANLADDLAMALKTTGVRIVAPIPGKSVIGIEVPNRKREVVYLREILADASFVNSESPLTLALGKDIFGVPYIADLTKMPHLLIAGSTGSGKSVALNCMIVSILFKSSPNEVKIILIDPKRLEFSTYDGIPHLLLPVVTDPKDASLALRWAVSEMERRYKILAALKVRGIDHYNKKIGEISKDNEEMANLLEYLGEDQIDLKPMPYIVIIIDELADLMMVAQKEVETHIARLAQMARASGIHLIVATQRPSVDVLTGTIKVNFPARISFQVSSKVDSRTILDTMGAESLLGRGDMLLLPPGTSKLKRVHGAYISEEEVEKIADFVRCQGEAYYDLSILEEREEGEILRDPDFSDEKYEEAVELVKKLGYASISLIQRHMRIGYNRAARIVERMEKDGIVGPQEGVKPRKVLIKE